MNDPKVTQKSYKVYQVIDLGEEFGVDFGKNESLKRKITQALIDKMKDRIASGLDINQNAMAAYSKEYKESKEFIAARKTGTVNMFLSGDMLGSIDVLKVSGNKVKIGFNDRTQELKAHGHMSGNVGVVREFFGISDDEIAETKDEFNAEIKKLENKK